MKYNEEAYLKAENVVTERYVKATTEYERRISETNERYPEIRRINDKISGAVSEIIDVLDKKPGNVSAKIEKIGKANLDAQEKRRNLLVGFGLPADYLDIHYTCKKCKDTGYVEGIRCECFEELILRFSAEEISKDCTIALHDFDDFKLSYYTGDDYNRMNTVFKVCKNYAENFSPKADSFLLIGNTGLGKTLLSSAIAKAVLLKGYSVVFESISIILSKIENDRFGRSKENTLGLITSADLVILDDLGSEFKSSFNESAIYDIINSRLNKGLPTIISTNYSFEELKEKYNSRIISRIDHQFNHLNFCGEDVRALKKSEK